MCLLAALLTFLDVSIVGVALPSTQAGLHASSSVLSWVMSGSTLTFGLALIPAGKLGDTLGRKPIFLIAVGVFIGASLLCGLSPSGAWLVIGRMLAGAAAGTLPPQVVGIVLQLFSRQERERGMAMGFYGATIAVSTALGPLAGGLLIQAGGTEMGWRWVFLVNVPTGVLTLILALRLLPHHQVGRKRRRLDLIGVGLLGAGVSSLMLPLINLGLRLRDRRVTALRRAHRQRRGLPHRGQPSPARLRRAHHGRRARRRRRPPAGPPAAQPPDLGRAYKRGIAYSIDVPLRTGH